MSAKPVVLYVEDDADSRQVMEIILQEIMGCETYYIFEDSQDFLARVTALQPQPEVILLDIHVPPHNGFAMIEMLRADTAYQQIPIVALTASVMNEEVQRLQHTGFNAVFAKPVNMDTFPDDLTRILQGETHWYIMT